MTEEAKKEIAVFNRGLRTYTTSKGQLTPQTSLTLPEKEAKSLMDYHDVVDFSKVAPRGGEKKLEAENKKLRAELEVANATIEKHEGKIADLEKKSGKK